MEIKQVKFIKNKKDHSEEIVVIYNDDTWFDYGYYSKGGRELNICDDWKKEYDIEDGYALVTNDGLVFQLTEIYPNN